MSTGTDPPPQERSAGRQPVLTPKTARSVHYHAPGCGAVDHDAAARLAREDAEEIGYRAHTCVGGTDA